MCKNCENEYTITYDESVAFSDDSARFAWIWEIDKRLAV